MQVSRAVRRRMATEAAKRPIRLQPVPAHAWPASEFDLRRIEVWLSAEVLVQVFAEDEGMLRVSVSSTALCSDGKWADGLTWDQLQDIKRQIGRADRLAVEVYPKEDDLVNVANMRHLWVLPDDIRIGWRRPR